MKIVTAYADLMNQYGETAALRLLRARLEDAGEPVEIVPCTVGSAPELEGCGLLYCPAGTESAMLAARRDAARYAPQYTAYFERGGLALCTGNALGLFAKEVAGSDGEPVEGIGWLDCAVRVAPGRRYTELIVQSGVFSGKLTGALNSSLRVESREQPLFKVCFDAAGVLGAPYEGMVKGGLLATQLTGPLLVRNPFALDELCERALGHPLPPCTARWYAYAVSGWNRALETLRAARKKGA